jgi:beta-mannosidase
MLTSITDIMSSSILSGPTELNSKWEYSHFSYCQTDDDALRKSKESVWRKAWVPGDIHLDLQRDGILPNLYFGQNFYSSIWVEKQDFMLRNYFDAPDNEKKQAVFLDFEGLDTYATIWLNGVVIGKTHNMFMTYSYDITNLFKTKRQQNSGSFGFSHIRN